MAQAAGLALPGSDLDVVVLGALETGDLLGAGAAMKAKRGAGRERAAATKRCLHSLLKRLKAAKLLHSSQLIHAKVGWGV